MAITVIINTVVSGGSTGDAVAADARAAAIRGDRIIVAAGRGRITQKLRNLSARQYAIGTKVEGAFHWLIARLFDADGCGSLFSTWRFIRRMKALKPSTVILHNIHGYYLNTWLLMRWLRRAAADGVRVEWRLHDLWPVTGHCAFLPEGACEKNGQEGFLSGCGKCPMKKAYPKTLLSFSRSNFKRKRRLIEPLLPYLRLRVTSRWHAEKIKRTYMGAAKFFDVEYPLVSRAYTEDKNGQREGYVLAVAWPWQKWKGLGDLPRIRELIPEDIDFVVVGLNSWQRMRLGRIGIVGVERLTNKIDLAWYYRHAAVFINPTYSESYGLTVREALACGTPVVTYAAGGTTEGLDECPELRAVPPGDVEALVKAALEMGHFTKE